MQNNVCFCGNKRYTDAAMNYTRLLRKRTVSFATLILVGLYILAQHFGVIPQTSVPRISQSQPGLYAISHFVDGDTIAVNMNGKTETVRFIGVDTPETHRPHTPVQCYGPAAAAFTKQQIGDNKVRLEADPQNTNRDRYNRLLRYVYLPDGTLLNKALVQKGYGFAYTQFPFSKKDEFVQAQDSAKSTQAGLWGNCQVITETNGRLQTNSASQ